MRGTHVSKPRKTDDVAALLFNYNIDQCPNSFDLKFYLILCHDFHSINKMSGRTDWSTASSFELLRRDFCSMMYYDYCKGKSFQKHFQSLGTDQCVAKATVFRQFRQVIAGVRRFEDDGRYNWMAMTVTPESICRVEFLIQKDPKMTCAEIQDVLLILLGSLTCILQDCHGVVWEDKLKKLE